MVVENDDVQSIVDQSVLAKGSFRTFVNYLSGADNVQSWEHSRKTLNQFPRVTEGAANGCPRARGNEGK